MCSVKRIVGLVDMDCFYVQVVQRKDPSIRGKPCAVVQYNTWRGGGIIAVSYEARKFGVTRQMRGDEAKKKCPDIVLVQVPENRGKADLTQFREAGAEVMEVLATFTGNLERASIDEAYMDFTDEINKSIGEYNMEDVALDTFKNTHLISLQNKDIDLTSDDELKATDLFKQWKVQLESTEGSYQLAIGAVIANKMRLAVQEKCGFTCSAGVGPNKMLAKIVAGFHKPNQQTLVFPTDVPEMFLTTKMRKIRSLGGKLGAQLEEKFHVEYMSQLVPLSLQELQSAVGVKPGEIVYWLCRGVDREPVRPRQLPKSIGCSKNFRGKLILKTSQDVQKWLTSLCEEVVERLEKDKEQNDRVATLFTVGCTNEKDVSQSRRCTVVKHSVKEIRDEAFRALCEFNNSRVSNEWKPPLINLNISASKFVGDYGASSGSNLIKSYMGKDQKKTDRRDAVEFEDSFRSVRTSDIHDNTISCNIAKSSSSLCISDTGSVAIFDCSKKNESHPVTTVQSSVSKKHISKYFSSSVNNNGNAQTEQVVQQNKRDTPTKAAATASKPGTVNSFFKKSQVKPLQVTYDNKNSQHYHSLRRKSSGNDPVVSISQFSRSSSVEPLERTEIDKLDDPIPVAADSPDEKSASFSNSRAKASTGMKSLPESPISSSKLSSKQQPRQSNRQTLFSRFFKPVTITKVSSFSSSSKGNVETNFKNTNLDCQRNFPSYHGKCDTGPDSQQVGQSDLNHYSTHSQSSTAQHAQPQADFGVRATNDLPYHQQQQSISLQMTTTINDLMICERCGKRLLAWDLPDHMDFHFASDLQESIQEKGLVRDSTQEQRMQPPARKKAKTTTSSLAKYFSPKKNSSS